MVELTRFLSTKIFDRCALGFRLDSRRYRNVLTRS